MEHEALEFPVVALSFCLSDFQGVEEERGGSLRADTATRFFAGRVNKAWDFFFLLQMLKLI